MTKLACMLHAINSILSGDRRDSEELAKLIAEVETLIVQESFMSVKPLDRLTVLSILKGIPDKTPFIVVFRTKKGDIREMLCIVDSDQAKGKQLDPSETFTVWDREKKAPRSFRLDSVYRIEVSSS